MFNLSITSIPVMVLGLMEQKTPIHELDTNPKFYKYLNLNLINYLFKWPFLILNNSARTITKNHDLSFKRFFLWTTIGIWHSLVAFFSPVFMMLINPSFLADSKVSGGDQLGAFVVFNIFIIVHIKVNIYIYIYIYFI